MTAAIVTAVVVAYLGVGLVFARSALRRWQADPKSLTSMSSDGADRAMSALGALAFGLIWPLSVGFLALRDWLWKPADRDEARREQMWEDYLHWLRESHNAATEQERATAKTIADTLDDLLHRGGAS